MSFFLNRVVTSRLRTVATAPPPLKFLLQRMKIPQLNRPRIIKNVVQKNISS
jgi:hypothetical protein